MITQREYVEGCQQWYREADLQPGNPEDGEWHECHYPLPRCLGGDTTILLLVEHHAIQGVLQSEECNHPSIYGWEKRYCTGEYLELFIKWRSELSRRAVAVTNNIPEHLRVARAKTASDAALEWRRQNPEEALRISHKASEASQKVLTPEKRAENARKGVPNLKRWIEENLETFKQSSSRGAKTQHAIRVRCLITGYISTPCGLSHYQRHRGIDPINRERVG